jgi:hypothetical protein
VRALGGNALLCHRNTVQESSAKSKGGGAVYSTLSIVGDAVLLDWDENYFSRLADAQGSMEQ